MSQLEVADNHARGAEGFVGLCAAAPAVAACAAHAVDGRLHRELLVLEQQLTPRCSSEQRASANQSPGPFFRSLCATEYGRLGALPQESAALRRKSV
jgi:hypothetical protein